MFTLALAACGGAPPPVAPAPPKAVVVTPEPPPDVTAVPEPAGLVLVGRVSKPEGILKTLGTWTRLPLPGGADLVRSMTDESVAESVDLSQPVDGAIALRGGKRDMNPLIAISVAVRSFDDAKAKLGAKHKLTPGKNGQINVDGIGRSGGSEGRLKSRDDDDDDNNETCVLSPAASGARLVCGERDALDLLSPYLTRTLPRQTWPSDVHLEMTLAALREPLGQVKAMLPVLARSMLGSSSPALAKLADAGVNELVDFVGDTNRMSLDAQLADAGIEATLKVDYTRAQSFVAKLATSNPQRADVPPPAFWHLPGDTDVALFGKGSDPKLFDHPKELLGNVFLEATEGAGMPEPERKAVRELVVDRMLSLFTGPLVYGKGYDAAALDKALAARNAEKNEPLVRDESDRVIGEDVLGWHLVQVTEPITKVGPILKDWSQLWNRPAFAKWAKQQSSAKMLAQMRIVPMPAGVTLPKDSVHLEIVMPRSDLDVSPVAPPKVVPPSLPRAGQKGAPPPGGAAVLATPKKLVPRKPLVLHIIAVPDQGGTWIGISLDGKLLAQKAAASLSTTSDAGTLGKTPAADALRDVKANGAWLATIRGFLVFTALERGAHSPYSMLSALPTKGTTPITMTFVSQGPSGANTGGSAVATLKLPRGAIEDIVRLAMSR
ncbi:MAG: hypothetical protein JWO86_1728 [Myxococcaceae bacterium]|jgi:hypothetical protein|nr:hypothetical protein [Myxococcaceae bacterium]MEA2751024.1 hypothetical protein [Myxococcales bacterium]